MSEFTRDQIEKFVSKGYESVSARYAKSAFEIIKDLEAERALTENNFTVITDEAYERIEELEDLNEQSKNRIDIRDRTIKGQDDQITELEAEKKQLYKLLSEIYNELTVDPYFTSTGRLNIAMWIKSICKRIKVLEGK